MAGGEGGLEAGADVEGCGGGEEGGGAGVVAVVVAVGWGVLVCLFLGEGRSFCFLWFKMCK